MLNKNPGAQMPERKPKTSQIPPTATAELTNIKVSPPMYL